jgi:acetyl-CoA carboxylase biotin carboxyl carrier protein
MELSYIKKIIKLVENSNVDEVEIEEEGKKIRVAKNRNAFTSYQVPITAPYPMPSSLPPPVSPVASEVSPAVPKPAAKPEAQLHEIRSPIVGTFYRAPAPDAESYVEVGQQVERGTVLCIVEAMKLMNEIESDTDGRIVQILAENGKPVEYNQVLFLIEKT